MIKQWCNEHGIWMCNPLAYTVEKCRRTWKTETNESDIVGNRPIDYALKDQEIIVYLSRTIALCANPEDAILEVGCNSGSNLNGLFRNGYKNLAGIEINERAFNQMKHSFPELYKNLIKYRGDAVEVIQSIPTKSIDTTFSMAVLMHIHPSQNKLFDEMVRVTRNYIITIENETQGNNYIFPRNYKRVFESRGCKETHSETLREINHYKEYQTRIFKVL